MKRSELLFTAIKPPIDYFTLIFAALIAYFVRYLPAVQEVRPVIFDLPFDNYLLVVITLSAIWLIIFALSGLYSFNKTKKFKDEFSRIVVSCSAGMAVVLAIMVFSRFLFDSRFIILICWLLAIIFLAIERSLIDYFQHYLYRFGIGIHRLAIIGNGSVVEDLKDEFIKRLNLGYRVIKQYNVFNEQARNELTDLAQNDGVDEILLITADLCGDQTAQLIDFSSEHHLVFKYAADLLDTRLTNFDVTIYAGNPVIEVKKTNLDGWGRIYKRLFDLAGSIFFILLFSPVMLITAIAIKFDSAGTIFFKYQRIGQYGKHFLYFKFRSMIKDAHKFRFDEDFVKQQENLRDGSPMMKFKNDPRVTRVGRFIRRFSIDELPEFFNVFIGKMSLVGPRPHEVEEVERYQKHHKIVLNIKPGITGLAQVSGRSDLDFEEEVKLDTFYIENWSLGLDLQILFKTPFAVLKNRKTE